MGKDTSRDYFRRKIVALPVVAAVGCHFQRPHYLLIIMETNTEVCGGLKCEEMSLSHNLITLPAELLVYIMSLLVIRDRIRLRYVSRRLRYVSKVAILWSDFSYYECKDDSDEYCVSGTLKECGELVKRLSFPNINMPSTKLMWLTENCVNVTELSLPPRVFIRHS